MEKKEKYSFLESGKVRDRKFYDKFMKVFSLTKLDVREAIPYNEPGAFWCNKIGAPIPENEQECGKFCPTYKQKSWLNRNCVHYSKQCYKKGSVVTLKNNVK